MTDSRNLMARFIDAYNAREWDVLDRLVSPTYVHHSGGADLTLADFKAGAAWLLRGLPDLTIEVLDTIAEGDRLVVRYAGHGTHSGSLAGEAPTGMSVTAEGITICRVEDGLIAEDWEAMDEYGLLKQVGVLA